MYRSWWDEYGGMFVAVVVGILIISAVGYGAIKTYKGSERDVTALVESKERVCKTDECEYLLFTDRGTFKLSDTILYTRFNTSDVYGRIKEGQTYDLRVVGWRIGFFSMYPNVLKATEPPK